MCSVFKQLDTKGEGITKVEFNQKVLYKSETVINITIEKSKNISVRIG